MSKPFDATLKDLGKERPADYLTTFDAQPRVPVQVLDVDLSTVTTASDLVLGLGRPLKEAVHIEFHASAAEDQHRDTLAYNALLYRRLKVPVHSMVLFLRPEARHRNDVGAVRYAARPGRSRMNFKYEIIPIWKWPVETFLEGPLGTVPLALLGNLGAGVSLAKGLPGVISRLLDRLDTEAAPATGARLLTSAYVLAGLRIDKEGARKLFQGALAMRESTTYQGILEEGRAEGRVEGRAEGRVEGRVEALQDTLLRLGRKRLGKPTKTIQAALQAISDVPRLERLSERLLDVSTWQDLFAD